MLILSLQFYCRSCLTWNTTAECQGYVIDPPIDSVLLLTLQLYHRSCLTWKTVSIIDSVLPVTLRLNQRSLLTLKNIVPSQILSNLEHYCSIIDPVLSGILSIYHRSFLIWNTIGSIIGPVLSGILSFYHRSCHAAGFHLMPVPSTSAGLLRTGSEQTGWHGTRCIVTPFAAPPTVQHAHMHCNITTCYHFPIISLIFLLRCRLHTHCKLGGTEHLQSQSESPWSLSALGMLIYSWRRRETTNKSSNVTMASDIKKNVIEQAHGVGILWIQCAV